MRRPFLILSGALLFGEVVMYFSSFAACFCLAVLAMAAVWAAGRKNLRILLALPFLFFIGMARMGSAVSESPLALEAQESTVKLSAAARISEIKMGSSSLTFYADQVVSLEGKPPGTPPLLKGAVVAFKNASFGNTSWEAGAFAGEECAAAGDGMDESRIPAIGDWVYGEAEFSLFDQATNFGQFDSRAYYRSMGLEGRLQFSRWKLAPSHSCFLKNKVFQVKSYLAGRLYRAAGADGGLLAAILLGEKSFLDEEDKALFQNGGMSHIYAVSGLHITFVGQGILKQMKKRGIPRKLRTLAAFLVAVLFWLLTGGSVSAKRACLMFCLSVLAGQIGRCYDFLNGVVAACDWILLEQPLAMAQPGFQQSFLAMAGILLATSLEKARKRAGQEPSGNGIEQRNQCKKQEIRERKNGSILRVSLWIQLTLLPATLWHYFQYPLYSLALNLFLVPQLGAALALGYLSLALLCLCPAAAGFSLGLARLLFALWRRVISWALGLPGAVLVLGRPEPARLAVYGAALAGWYLACRYAVHGLRAHKCFARRYCGAWHEVIGLALLLPTSLLLLARMPGPGLTVAFLDVGQGDGIYIQEESGFCMMLDGGSSDIRAVGERRLLPYLKAMGCGKVDDWFLSHPDVDHLSGLRELLETGFPVSRLWISEVFRENDTVRELEYLAQKAGCQVRFTGPGLLLSGESLSLECLYPEKGQVVESANNGSMVLLLEYEGASMLFPGDLEQEGERSLLEPTEKAQTENGLGITQKAEAEKGDGKAENAGAENRLGCQILKAGHHGSKGSTGEAFLEKVSPGLTVISCGKNNSYGHPHEETLKRLEKSGSKVLTTMESGAVTVTVVRREIRVSTFLP